MRGQNKRRKAKTDDRIGFTIMEMLVIILVIAVLAVISGVAYIGLQKRASDAVTMDTLKKATNEVLVTIASKHSVPSTIDGMFNLPEDVTLTYIDNTTEGGLPLYSGLTPPQSGKLFYDICREQVTDGLGNGPNDFGAGTIGYITACNVYNTNYLQINGWNGGFNVSDPSVSEETLQGYVNTASNSHPNHPSYRATLQHFMDTLINRFKAQGGSFPITSFWQPWVGEPTLPPPTSYTTTINSFCMIATSTKYPDISYITSLKDPVPKHGTGCE